MTPTDDLRNRLRRALDEAIPTGGTDADTRFLDSEIDELLTDAAYLEAAAAEGWTRKAARAISERGGLEESSVGSEKLKFVSIDSYRRHCLDMAALYRARVPGVGSRVLAFEAPDVLGAAQS